MRKRVVFSWLSAVVAVLLLTGPAQAFYWYGWPGSRVPPRKTIVGPPDKHAPENPPEVPVNPPVVPPVVPPTEPVPEPATALAALAGLGALAAARLAANRRRSHRTADTERVPPGGRG
jgi:MYXO-CTERM domain-containing protein